MPKTCPHCKSSELDVDPSRGDTVCTGCGSVLEENTVVSEVSFVANSDGSSSMVGQFMSNEASNQPHFAGFRYSLGKDSRKMTLDRGRREIKDMASGLHLNTHCVDTAYNFFKMAIQKRLSRGRRIQHLVAACLYMACRIVGTPHMLLDFSDITQVNVFTLGKTFLTLAKELHIQLPILDPCIYITRFAHRMDFGNKTRDVCFSAMRMVSRMKRDWLHTGRRPSGLCGAALLVAARLHGYTCTLSDVVKVVKIGQDTIRKRLTEFVSTPSSQLTINEFMRIDLESEADPPCFTESRLKQKQANMEQLEAQIGQLSNVIDLHLVKSKRNGSGSELQSTSNCAALVDDTPQDPDIQSAADFIHSENPEEVARGLSIKFGTESEIPSSELVLRGPLPSTISLGLKDAPKDLVTIAQHAVSAEEQSDTLDLNGINDEEIDQMILSSRESAIKTKLWMAENGEYVKEMEIKAEKRRLEEEEREKTRPKKPKKKLIPRKDYYANSQTAGEAIEKLIKRSKLSSKINYDALKRATSDLPQDPIKSKPKFLESFSSLAKYDMAPKIERDFVDDAIIEEYEPKPKVRKTEKITPCLNPMYPAIESVKPEVIVETEHTGLFAEPTEESGPIPAAEMDCIYDDEEEDNILSASQLMEKAGVGDTMYGGEGYDEYD